MDEAAMVDFVRRTLGSATVANSGATFFFYDPGAGLPVDHRMPFATLVTSDAFDQASDLNRPGVYRLNIGVRKETFQALFPGGASGAAAAPDFTALDVLLPHPVYAAQSWICVLNPGARTFERLGPLLAEAHEISAARYARRERRDGA